MQSRVLLNSCVALNEFIAGRWDSLHSLLCQPPLPSFQGAEVREQTGTVTPSLSSTISSECICTTNNEVGLSFVSDFTQFRDHQFLFDRDNGKKIGSWKYLLILNLSCSLRQRYNRPGQPDWTLKSVLLWAGGWTGDLQRLLTASIALRLGDTLAV